MEFTKEQLEGFKKDPLMNFFASLLGTNMEEIINGMEQEKSHSEKVDGKCANEPNLPEVKAEEDEDNIGKRIEDFFNKMVKEGKATKIIENGCPHYSVKMDENWDSNTTSPEELVEESDNCENGVSFSMSKDELAEFIKNYTKLENTFRKLEHTFGIDLNANADSIYTQYNTIVWNLIEKIFGEDNRDDIADYVFGDSNFDTIDDLYEELV